MKKVNWFLKWSWLLVGVPALLLVACGPASQTDLITTDSGLQYQIIKRGEGSQPQAGQIVEVHYTGQLEDGSVFDSSRDRGQTFSFVLGQGDVIPGWDEGIGLLHVGDQARLILPPELAYGETGTGDVIPANAILTFDVELVSVRDGAPASPTKVNESDYTTTTSGLKYYDLVVGNGIQPQAGQTITAHYTGWLLDGTQFDSSLNRGQSFSFVLGEGRVIPGWEEGLGSMQVGGKRQLLIPPDLGYGTQGGGPIPPNATLIFEVELLDVK